MLTVLSLKKARESESLWQSILSCKALHITDRIEELTPEDFSGLDHIEHLVIGPQLEEMHAENSGFRPSGRGRTASLTIPEFLFCELRSLRELEITMKGITELRKNSFAGLPYLECLTLSKNSISYIHRDAFRGLGNLKSLYLDRNRLTEVDSNCFSYLSFLNVLRLDSNGIVKIATKAFAGNPFLIMLSLQRNKISRLSPSTFAGLNSLTHLDLGSNPLSSRDLKFMQHLGHFAQISIQTKKGNLTISRASLARAM